MSHDRLLLLGVYLLALAAGIGAAQALPDALHPLVRTLLAAAAATGVIFLLGSFRRSASLFDPFWSVAPPIIALSWLLTAPHPPRLLAVLTVLVVGTWGVRLTAHFLSGWPGMGQEDWRYVQIRQQTGAAFPLVNLLGIHLIPTLLVWGGLLPVWYLLTHPDAQDRPGVVLGLLLALGATALEAVADAQLRRFRRQRHSPRQLLAEGLWSLCRHPNYLGELLFWWGLWLAGVFAVGAALWTGIGALAITILLQAVSIPLLEQRMLQHRPHYAALRERIHALLPWPS